MPEPFTLQQAIQSLFSRLCPQCGQDKLSRKTFCRICYFRLPAALQADLYKSIRDGYVDAVNAARTWLTEHPPQPRHGRHKTSEVEAEA